MAFQSRTELPWAGRRPPPRGRRRAPQCFQLAPLSATGSPSAARAEAFRAPAVNLRSAVPYKRSGIAGATLRMRRSWPGQAVRTLDRKSERDVVLELVGERMRRAATL